MGTRATRWLAMGCVGVALVAAAGCHPIDSYDRSLESPAPPTVEPPRELAMVSLPAYRIAPPDILTIELLKLVPIPPYRLEVYDALQVQVVGTLLDQPIDGYFLIEADGTINLGPAYGLVRVAGMTLEQARTTIDLQLRRILKRPEVSVQLARASGLQPIAGEYLVGPDGTVNLRQYGLVYVAGLTLMEAKLAIERHLAQYLDSPEVVVDVAAYNSKVYYVITAGAGMGDNVVRVPITGNETVLDAITQVGGLSQVSSKKIWIARPAPGGFGCEQVLPVQWDAIVQGGATATNYQILPGDRVFVSEDGFTAWTNTIGRLTGPFERVLGFSSLGSSTIRSFKNINSNYGGY